MTRLAGAALVAALASGCASIHSYDAPRDINPSKLSLSTSVGTTFDRRDRNGDGDLDDRNDGWKRERVLVPDAKLNLRIRLNEVLSLAIDPLPPTAGAGIVGRWVPEVPYAPTITIAPMASYLVFPRQDIWSVEVPLALSKRIGNHFVVYAGPKYLQQSNVLQKESGFVQGIVLSGVPKRDEQSLRFMGGFLGFGFGWLHLQFSPEVLYYKSLRGDEEEVVQIGTQVRIAL